MTDPAWNTKRVHVPLNEIMWRTPVELLAARESTTWEELTIGIRQLVPPARGTPRIRPGDGHAAPLQVGLDHKDVELYQLLDFPLSVNDIIGTLASLERTLQIALAQGNGAKWTSIEALLRDIGGEDLQGVVDWAEVQVITDSDSSLVSVECFVDPVDESREALGFDFYMSGDHVGALMWFPLEERQLEGAIRELHEHAMDTFDHSWPRVGPDVLTLFPFLDEELDAVVTRTSEPGFTKELAASFVERWAAWRLADVLSQIPGRAQTVMKLDIGQSVGEIVDWAIDGLWWHQEGAPDWLDEAPSPATPAPPPIDAVDPSPLSGGPTPSPQRHEVAQSPWVTLTPQAISIAMLILAYGPHPYAFFEALRWVVALSAVITMAALLNLPTSTEGTSRTLLVLGLGAVTIVFNPVFPVTSAREVWFWVDAATIGCFVGAGWALWPRSVSPLSRRGGP